MPLFKQDILRTNKRYVTKIVAGDVAINGVESITIGLTGSAFMDGIIGGTAAAKLHSVFAVSDPSSFSGAQWTIRWGNTYGGGTYGQVAHDCLYLNGVDDSCCFTDSDISHHRTGVKAVMDSGTVTVSLDNSANGEIESHGTIILEFTI